VTLKNHPLFNSLLVWLITPLLGLAARADDYFVFTSFRGNGEDGLHLSLSQDGFKWTPLNGDKSFLRSTIGGQLMRAPGLAQGPDGTFHLVWTTSWTAEQGKWVGYACSRDLIEWTPPRGIPVMQDEPAARNIWAPELFYDALTARWLIYWSTTIPGRFPESDQTGDSGYNHRLYATTTADFQTFAEARLFYDPGFNCIDATLVKDSDRHVLFFKDERKNPVKKNLRYATAARAGGPFGAPAEPFTGEWVEGPSAIRIGEWLYVYFDHYAAPHYYGAVRSKDLKTWEDVSKQMSFPPDHRHGTVVRIPPEITVRLRALGK
jgi:hypothetical protein